MPKKLETVKLIAGLEKAARLTKKNIWSDLAKRLNAPSRNAAAINLEQLDGLAKRFKGKTLVVPGKVLAQGELNEKTVIVAVSASESAKNKINAKAKFVSLAEFLKGAQKTKASDLVIVK